MQEVGARGETPKEKNVGRDKKLACLANRWPAHFFMSKYVAHS